MWYNRVVADLSQIPAFITYYENELNVARGEIKIQGNVERALSNLPGQTEYRFNQLQEVEAVLNYLNIQLRKIRQKHYKKYLEAYARALTSRDAEKYAEAEDEVIDMETIINEVALVRNKWLGVMKGVESKNFMLGHVVRLRTAGMEDVVV
jgi:16S rRNA C967 or C1407 C5-methylase (RsmB/RsmF family)